MHGVAHDETSVRVTARTAVQASCGEKHSPEWRLPTWRPPRRSPLVPSRTDSSNLHVISWWSALSWGSAVGLKVSATCSDAIRCISFHILSTPVVDHPLPISLSGNLRNGLGINTTMKKFVIFVPVQVVFENTHTLTTATAYSAPNRTGQTGQAPLFVQ